MNAPSFQLALKLALTLSIVRQDADLDAENRPYLLKGGIESALFI